jgi:hypothetical protein
LAAAAVHNLLAARQVCRELGPAPIIKGAKDRVGALLRRADIPTEEMATTSRELAAAAVVAADTMAAAVAAAALMEPAVAAVRDIAARVSSVVRRSRVPVKVPLKRRTRITNLGVEREAASRRMVTMAKSS